VAERCCDASPAPGESFASTSTTFDPSSARVAVSSAAVGNAFVAPTSSDAWTVLDSAVPSLARKVNESGPWYPVGGGYVKPPLALSAVVPCAVPATSEYVSASPSASVHESESLNGVSCGVWYDTAEQTGARFPLTIVIVTVAGSLSSVPSLARNVNVTVPL